MSLFLVGLLSAIAYCSEFAPLPHPIDALQLGMSGDEVTRLRPAAVELAFFSDKPQKPDFTKPEVILFERLPDNVPAGNIMYGFKASSLTFVGVTAGEMWDTEQAWQRRQELAQMAAESWGKPIACWIVTRDARTQGKRTERKVPMLVWRFGQQTATLLIPVPSAKDASVSAFELRAFKEDDKEVHMPKKVKATPAERSGLRDELAKETKGILQVPRSCESL